MKKTMIAMAVAGVVAAPIASAEVSISGVIEQTFVDEQNNAEGWTTNTFNMLNFSASEDLGNGMSAFAKSNFLVTGGLTSSESNADQVVGISGDFGTVVAGTMEDFTEGKIASKMTLQNAGAAIELGGNAGRTDGGLAYVSPTVSGFHVGIAGYAGSGVSNTDAMDATDVAIFYDNGPISIAVAKETLNKELANANASATASGATADQETTSVYASYTMGDLKVSGLSVGRDNQKDNNSSDNVGNDSTDLMMRVDYTMGNNKITIASADDDSANLSSTTAIELTHNFSGQTSAYVGHVNKDSTLNDSTYVGLQHKF